MSCVNCRSSCSDCEDSGIVFKRQLRPTAVAVTTTITTASTSMPLFTSAHARQPSAPSSDQARRLTSVGIDVGTTTSQVIFSALEIVNTAGPSSVPHYEFSKREISYVSPVLFTPFDALGQVDTNQLEVFVRQQYRTAGFEISDIESGAVIITGETSKARNARETVMMLAQNLGDFVVATAGPHLESVIAGRGSGAGEYSRKNAARTLNIDVGGGTSNYAVFEGGRLVDTACLNVGGHLIQTSLTGEVTHVHPPAELICQSLFGVRGAGDAFTQQQLQQVAKQMATLILEVLENKPSLLATQLLMTNSLREAYRFDAIFISGGVGECMVRPPSASPYCFGDIGPLLAKALSQKLKDKELPVLEPLHTLHATVIGAGAHTLMLSGSTVWNKYEGKPLRNVPVVHSRMSWRDYRPDALAASWQISVQGHDLNSITDLYALALPDNIPITCQTVWQATLELQKFTRIHATGSTQPLVVVTSQDMGKALGMELSRLVPTRPLVVLDEVATREGDYLDIGSSYFKGGAIPLTVKSLAFPQ